MLVPAIDIIVSGIIFYTANILAIYIILYNNYIYIYIYDEVSDIDGVHYYT